MATVKEIEDSIDAAIAANPLLADLSTSEVAEWLAMKKSIAEGMFLGLTSITIAKDELQALADSAPVASPEWIAEKALAFQYGDTLEVINKRSGYSVIDESKQIVKHVAVPETPQLVIKVATETGGELAPLTTDQFNAFKSYMNKVKGPGVQTGYVSTTGDLLWLNITVYYNGEIPLPTIKAAVEAAIQAFIKDIFFNGKFNIYLLQNAIEKVTGVKPGKVLINFAKAKPSGGTYSNVTFEHSPYSGYYNIDPDHPITSSDQLTYIAE